MRLREIMTEAGLKEDNTTNRAAWMKKITSYTGDSVWREKPGMKKKTGVGSIRVAIASGW